MKIIRPMLVTEAMVTAHSVPEPAPGEQVWNATTSYAPGAQVIRTQTHSVYVNVAASAGVDATVPESASTRWKRLGATNRWRTFGQRVQSQTTALGSVSFTVQPNKAIDAIAIFNVTGQSVRVQCGLFDQTLQLRRRTVTGWYSYLFEEFGFLRDLVFFGLPPLRQPITVTVTQTAGQVAGIGPCVMGASKFLGGTQYGASPGIKDYSAFVEAFDGSLEIQERAFAKTMRLTVEMVGSPQEVAVQIDEVCRLMAQYRATPVVYVGGDGMYECLTALGIFRNFQPVIEGPTKSIAQYEIRGFT